MPLGAALTQRRAVEAALRLGDRPAARELLHAAHDTLARLGAVRLRDDCAAALARLGERPRPARKRVRATAAGLSGRELDVMRLVARGNTTRQIGDALFISPRTVEMHVRGSLLKLGCRTRAEGVRRLAELDALPPPGPAGQ